MRALLFSYHCLTLGLLVPCLCAGQTGSPGSAIAVKADPKVVTRYPSLEPVTVIDLELGMSTEVLDVLPSEVAGGWDCWKTSSYKVTVTTGVKTSDDPVVFVNVVGQVRNRPCDAQNINLVQLTTQIPLNENQKFQVFLQNLKKSKIQTDSTAGPKGGNTVAFTATPQSAVGETLINKKTRDTGQLSVSFSDTDFIRNLPVDLYVKSIDLFSTDERDSKSAFSGTVGFNRGLFNSWYSPWHLEAGMQGNQIASNLSGVVNTGVTTLLPWKPAMTELIQIPLPPDITLNGQYTNRLRQDPATGKMPLATNDFTLNPSLAWTAISLPWSCRLFSWLNKDKSAANKSAGAAAQYTYCAGLEADAGLWYLPLDRTSKGSQRVEGYGDVSILIPLAVLKFASGIAPHLTSGDYTRSRIRIKYSDSVNAANNYIRTKAWSYGIELTGGKSAASAN